MKKRWALTDHTGDRAHGSLCFFIRSSYENASCQSPCSCITGGENADNYAATPNHGDCCITTQAAMQENGQAGQPSQSTKTKTETGEEKEEEFPPRGAIVAAPLPIVSPAIGAGIIPGVGYIFPFGKDDKLSPPSTVGAAGLITNNGSSGFAVAAQLFMKENTYAVTTLYFHGNVNYNLYGIGTALGNGDLKVPLDQAGQLYFGEALRRIPWQFFIGPRFLTGDSVVTVRPSSGETAVPPADLGLHTTLRALGIHVMRDTRPNHFYPTTGMFTQFTSDFFAQALGSKYTFQSYRFTFNKYWTVGKNQVLAYNLLQLRHRRRAALLRQLHIRHKQRTQRI